MAEELPYGFNKKEYGPFKVKIIPVGYHAVGDGSSHHAVPGAVVAVGILENGTYPACRQQHKYAAAYDNGCVSAYCLNKISLRPRCRQAYPSWLLLQPAVHQKEPAHSG